MCFNEEYHLIDNAIENHYLINFSKDEEKIIMLPIFVITCPINNELYVFGLMNNNDQINILRVRLCKMTHIQNIAESINIEFNDSLLEEINSFIDNLEYLDNDIKMIGGN